jgi:hypothetical protein
MNIKDITQKLIEKADDDLQKEVDAAAKPLYCMLFDGSPYKINLGGVEHNWVTALNALKQKAIELHTDQRRQAAIDAFMSRVEQIGNDIDELRQSIPQ